MSELALIVAVGRGGVIGHDNGLPWRQSADLKRFKALTMGHPMIMGRRTHESIGKALPGRDNIVLTRSAVPLPDGCVASDSIGEALARVAGRDAFVIGGGQIYREMLPLVTRICVTFVDAAVAGDTHFPQVDWSAWSLTAHESHPADDANQYPMTFMNFRRRDDTLAPAVA